MSGRGLTSLILCALSACGRIGFDDRVKIEPSAHVRRVASGARFTCAVRADGTVWCWGEGRNDVLGDTGGAPRATPVQIANLTEITAIDAGDEHACALRADGTVWCWGGNENGQLGLAGPDRPAPTRVIGVPPNATQLSMGAQFACARFDDSSAWCWGLNDHGQIDGAALTADILPRRASVDDVVEVEAGELHTCVLDSFGAVSCWGYEADGRLGRPSADDPAPIPGFTAIDLALWRASCAVLPDGHYSCWGNNFEGEFGDGNSGTSSSAPIPPSQLAKVAALTLGDQHTCALHSDGTVACWGNNDSGQLGTGDLASQLTPVEIAISNVVSLSAGGEHTCALLGDDSVWCWGRSSNGELGNGAIGSFSPHAINFAMPVTAVAAGGHHTCAVAGGLYCWGQNDLGEVGDGTAIDRATPQLIAIDVLRVVAGNVFTCAWNGSSTWCWGSNENGDLGTSSGQGSWPTPAPVTGLGGVDAVAAGDTSACALVGGALSCWGRAIEGQLGNNDPSQQPAPVPVTPSYGTAVSIGVGGRSTCATNSLGEVWCWGYNSRGQLGNGTNGNQGMVPSLVALAAQANLVATAGGHTCAAKSSNGFGLACWGANGDGELGDGSTHDALTPVTVPAFVALVVDHVAAGPGTSCASTTAGLSCWGNNTYGTLGDGTGRGALIPQAVAGFGSISALAVGEGHACAISGGTLYCWGDDAHGEQATGTFARALKPVQASLP